MVQFFITVHNIGVYCTYYAYNSRVYIAIYCHFIRISIHPVFNTSYMTYAYCKLLVALIEVAGPVSDTRLMQKGRLASCLCTYFLYIPFTRWTSDECAFNKSKSRSPSMKKLLIERSINYARFTSTKSNNICRRYTYGDRYVSGVTSCIIYYWHITSAIGWSRNEEQLARNDVDWILRWLFFSLYSWTIESRPATL